MALDQWSQFIKDTRLNDGSTVICSKSCKFASGLVLSIQASKTHYCTPKENDPAEGWTSFEVYAWSRVTLADQRTMGVKEPEGVWMRDAVGWVTVAQLDIIAESHGGISGCVEESL